MIIEHYEITLVGQKRASKIEFYLDAAEEIRWRCLAGNGEIIGASSEGYTTLDNAKKNTFMLSCTLGAFKFKTNDDGF